MQIFAKGNRQLYAGQGGFLIFGDFAPDVQLPPGRVELSIVVLLSDQEQAINLLRKISNSQIEIASGPMDKVLAENGQRYDHIKNACVVITADNPVGAFTNIENPNIAKAMLVSSLQAIVRKLNEQDDAYNGTSYEDADCDDDEYIDETKEALDQIVGNPQIIPDDAKRVQELTEEMSNIENEARRHIATNLFVNGLLSFTCESKKEYAEMINYLADAGVVITKSVNKEGWSDVCKYVYGEMIEGPDEDECIVVAKAKFRLPDTIDRIVTFKEFKDDQETLIACMNRCEQVQAEAKSIAAKYRS